MATLRDIKSHIQSIKNIAKVTNALKAVAAARHQRLRSRVSSSQSFASSSWNILEQLVTAAQELANDPLLRGYAQDSPAALLVFSSNRGMAGDFDQVIIAQAVRFIRHSAKPPRLLTVGKAGRDGLLKMGHHIEADFGLAESASLEAISPIGRVIMDGFVGGRFGSIHVLYTQYNDRVRLSPTIRQLLPVQPGQVRRREWIFEPDAHALLASLLPRIIRFQIYESYLESRTAETAARMMAMDAATRNAGDLMENLQMAYNKVRQQSITSDLLDIIGGANALQNV